MFMDKNQKRKSVIISDVTASNKTQKKILQ